jgi:hypothetical protein
MPKLIPKKTFLLRQIIEDGKKPKDVIATKGVAIDVTNEEAVKFAGYWDVREEKEKKKIMDSARLNPQARRMV